MATTNKKINVTDLDFDQIKSNLKTFLSGQTEFQDYDFEGSAMSVLLDVLAYNTHYNALYNNLSINEMFLDSARKRNSVVSIAKMLGYTPRSARCASAVLTVSVTTNGNSGLTNLTLPAYTQFTTTVDGTSYTFFNRETQNASSTTGTFVFNNVTITEGTPLSFNVPVSAGSRYILPNAGVDLSTLAVRVQDSSGSTVYKTYTKADTLVNVTSTSMVYWVKEIDDGLYELTFGDDILGVALSNGNVVHMNYMVSSLGAPNGARAFSYNGGTLVSGSAVSLTTVSTATGGSDLEAVDSIRSNAPKIYSAQNRAVTPDDYKALIYSEFPEAESISCWGGEDNVPPVYGQVFLCIKPKNSEKLSTAQKSEITSSILSRRNVVSVAPKLVDPEYINLEIASTVYFNPQATSLGANDIIAMVKDTIAAYDIANLSKFDGIFRMSQLSKQIDATDECIVSNTTTVLLRRKMLVQYNTNAQYFANMINPIYSSGQPEGAVQSNGFYIAGSTVAHFLDDDGVGNIRLYRYSGAGQTGKTIVNPSIGKVNYTLGTIDIKNLNITDLQDVDFEITIKPLSYDVVSALTQIVRIAPEHLTVSAIADKTASGDLRGGYNYTFTSNRS